jgi:hypothetical protein
VPTASSNAPTSTSDSPFSKQSTVTKQSGPSAFTQSFGWNTSQFVNEWAVRPISQLQDHIPSFLLTSLKPRIFNHLPIPFSPPLTSFPDKQSPYRNNLTTSKTYIQKSTPLVLKLRSDLNKYINEQSKTTTSNEVT